MNNMNTCNVAVQAGQQEWSFNFGEACDGGLICPLLSCDRRVIRILIRARRQDVSLTFDRNAEMLVTCSLSQTCDLFNIIHFLSFGFSKCLVTLVSSVDTMKQRCSSALHSLWLLRVLVNDPLLQPSEFPNKLLRPY